MNPNETSEQGTFDAYWITCAPGLERFVLEEWQENLSRQGMERMEHKLEWNLPGGILLRCPVGQRDACKKNMMRWKTADNVYAFVCNSRDISMDHGAGLQELERAAQGRSWNQALEVYRHWQGTSNRSDDASKETGRGRSIPVDSKIEGEAMDARDHPSPPDRRIPMSVETQFGLPETFRVTCERRSDLKERHQWTSVQASAKLGEALIRRFAWKVSLERFDLEVKAWIRDEAMVVALALLYTEEKGLRGPNENGERSNADVLEGTSSSKSSSALKPEHVDPISLRSIRTHSKDNMTSGKRKARGNADGRQLYTLLRKYRKALVSTSLRPSIAHCLCKLAELRADDLLLDPMAGCGTIPLEGGYGWDVRGAMAGDIDFDALNSIRHNGSCLRTAHGRTPPDVMSWDARKLPIRTGCVDCIITDMPFGNMCGKIKHRFPLYLSALQEFGRVLRPGRGRAVFLLQSRKLDKILDSASHLMDILDVLPVEMNGMRVSLCILRRRIPI